jgi:periplasmic divalent cation tolerance protein
MNETKYAVVISTVPSMDVAREIAHDLVENMLAACVNIAPKMTSVYEWDGKIVVEKEVLLLIKTKVSFLDKLIERIEEIHPYDTPEVVAIPILAGNKTYLDWIDSAIDPMKKSEEDS